LLYKGISPKYEGIPNIYYIKGSPGKQKKQGIGGIHEFLPGFSNQAQQLHSKAV
jgi:hypothetical protein